MTDHRTDWKGPRAKKTFRIADEIDRKLTRAAKASGLTRNEAAQAAIDRFATAVINTKGVPRAKTRAAQQIDLEDAIASTGRRR